MVDCRETKARYRFDHLLVYAPASGDRGGKPFFCYLPDSTSEQKQKKKAEKAFGEVVSLPLTSVPT